MSHEPHAAEFDAYSETYADAVNRSIAFSGLGVDFFTRVKAEYLIDIVEARRPPARAAALLDLGCGVGNYHPLLRGRLGQIKGVDVSEACLATARHANPDVRYTAYDGRHLPQDDAAFDVVLAVCVFHHVPLDARAALAGDARRVLRPGGLFVIFEHNPLNPLTRRAVDNCAFDKDAVLLKRGESERLMKQAGFRDVESRFILAIPAAGAWLRKIDRLFSRIPLGAQYYTIGRA
jgi:SAM-dependent methyltransferase